VRARAHTEHRVENMALHTASLGKNLCVSHHRFAFTDVTLPACSVWLLMLQDLVSFLALIFQEREATE